jgi:zinc transporter
MHQPAFSIPDVDSPFAWIYRFDQTGEACALSTPEPLRRDDGCFLWLHLNIADARAREWISHTPDLPPEARIVLGDRNDHQLLLGSEDYICGVFTDFTREFEGSSSEGFGQIRFVVTKDCIVTARRHPVHSARLLRDAVHAGEARPKAPVDLFEMLLGYMLEAVERRGEALLEELDEIEDHVLEEELRDERRRLGPLRRGTVRLHRIVNGMQRVVSRFELANRIPEITRTALHRIAQRLDSLHHDLNAVQDRARLLHDEIGAQLSDEANSQLFRLTILGTLIMPPTLITGFFGMNLKGLPLSEDEHGAITALILCLISSAVAYGIVWYTGRVARKSRG